jgi:hypothetical protein
MFSVEPHFNSGSIDYLSVESHGGFTLEDKRIEISLGKLRLKRR